jgi:hypothetical protein
MQARGQNSWYFVIMLNIVFGNFPLLEEEENAYDVSQA